MLEEPKTFYVLLAGPFICLECRTDMTMNRKSGILQCSTPSCSAFGKQFYWPNCTLEEAEAEE